MRASTDCPQPHARALPYGIATAALYGSLALISAVVFGTLSVHPF